MNQIVSICKHRGFTLLEVLISITLTALVLGNLFALQSQSKRLNFKAQSNLHKIINQRAYFNAVWVNSRELDSYMDELPQQNNYSHDNRVALKKPKAETKPLKFSLESFDIVNQQNEVILSSVRIQDSNVSLQ